MNSTFYHSILLKLISFYLSLTPTLIHGSYFDISSCSNWFPCIHVATTGDDTQVGSVSSPVRTIQRALDLVVPHSPALPTRIVLQDGSYPGGIVWKGSAVTLISVHGSDSTFITCSQPNQRGIWIGSGESATTIISGVTIQNCSINMGAGMAIVGVNTRPTLRNVVFRNNQAINGAGLLAFLSSPVLICTEFYDGDARDGGGLYVVHNATAIPLLQFQQMSLAVNYQHPAGAPIPDGINAVIISTDMRATGNKALSIGGGIYSLAATLVLSRAIFQSNQGAGSGGIALSARSRLTISDSSFIGNRALKMMSGAIAVRQGSWATVTRVTFIENEAAESGGAIAVGEPASTLNVDTSTFIANKATQGSIIAFDPTPRIGSTITNSRATGNIASENGGIFFANVPTARNVNLSSNIFENNQAAFAADYGSIACSIGFISTNQDGDSTHTPAILPTGFATQISRTVNNLATIALRILMVDVFGQRITAPGVVNDISADVIAITPTATPASLVMSNTRIRTVDGRVNVSVALIGQTTATYAIRFTGPNPLMPPARVLVTVDPASPSCGGCFSTAP